MQAGEIKDKDLIDKEIILKVLAGATEDFELIMRKYNQRMFRVGISYLHDEQDVEDAMQNTYLNCFNSLSRFNFSSDFSTWLTRIMINECLQILRKERSYQKIDITTILPEMITTTDSGEKELINKEMKLLLEKSIMTLPYKYRSAYILRQVEELSTSETAKILNINESNVKVRLYRAKEMLRQELIRLSGEVNVFTFGSERCDEIVKNTMLLIKE